MSRCDARDGEPGLRALEEGIITFAIAICAGITFVAVCRFVRSRLDLGAPGHGLGIWESSTVAASCWCTTASPCCIIIVVIIICTDGLSQ
jgi:hypothetical protein